MGKKEFYSLSYRQFHALIERHREHERRRDDLFEVMMGQQIAMTANTGFARFEKPRRAEEFMPSYWEKRAAKKPRRRYSRREQLEIANSFRLVMTAHSQLPQKP